MLKFNIEKARKAGFTDNQIIAYLSKNQPQTQTQAVPQEKESLITSLLPLLGSLVGGGVGTLVAPGVGTIAGSAIGSGLGELGRQGITGQEISGGRILGESALGGLGAGAGLLLGGGLKAARAGRVVQAGAKVAGGTDEGLSLLQKLGVGIKGKPYAQTAITTKSLLKGRNIAPRATAIGKSVAGLKGVTPGGKLTSLAKEREQLNTLLKGVTESAETKAIPVSGNDLVKMVKTQGSLEFDFTTGVGKSNLKYWTPRIRAVKNMSDLGKLNEELLTKMAGSTGEKTKALRAIQKSLGETFKQGTGTEDIFAQLSQLNINEPVIRQEAGKMTRLPFLGTETRIPQNVASVGRSAIGNAVGAAGTPLGGQVAGQIGTRALMPSGQAETYQPPQVEGITEGYTPKPTKKSAGLKITAEQAALARLILPDKQADAIEAAYKLLNEKTTASASQEFLDKAASNIQSLQNTKKLGYGPATGRLYELQLKALGGAGAPEEAVALNQRYNLLKLNILRAYQGARISDKDFELAGLYIPNVSDTDETARTKLAILNDILVNAQPPSETELSYQLD